MSERERGRQREQRMECECDVMLGVPFSTTARYIANIPQRHQPAIFNTCSLPIIEFDTPA